MPPRRIRHLVVRDQSRAPLAHVAEQVFFELTRELDAQGVSRKVSADTYSFEVWDGHPLAGEVLGTLRRFRDANTNLRERVRAHNEKHTKPPNRLGVVIYAGQTTWDLEESAT